MSFRYSRIYAAFTLTFLCLSCVTGCKRNRSGVPTKLEIKLLHSNAFGVDVVHKIFITITENKNDDYYNGHWSADLAKSEDIFFITDEGKLRYYQNKDDRERSAIMLYPNVTDYDIVLHINSNGIGKWVLITYTGVDEEGVLSWIKTDPS